MQATAMDRNGPRTLSAPSDEMRALLARLSEARIPLTKAQVRICLQTWLHDSRQLLKYHGAGKSAEWLAFHKAIEARHRRLLDEVGSLQFNELTVYLQQAS